MIIAVLRYAVVPALGTLVAGLVYWRLDGTKLARRLAERAGRRVTVATALVVGVFCVLLVARYATWHTHVFDLGIYDQKIWVASAQTDLGRLVEQTWRGGERVAPCGAVRYWGICHFQPLYAVYALIYRVWSSPLLLLLSQMVLVVSGAIPCYLLGRDVVGSEAVGALGAGLFLLYPAVQFNALLDFRPDHVAIPCLLWAYWCLEGGRTGAAIAMAGLPGLAKESLILTFMFFGLYLVALRRRLAGLLVFGAGAAVFAFIVFAVLGGPGRSEGAFMIGRYFSGGPALLEPALVASKVVYLVGLFGPLALLCFRSPLKLLPALPSLGISLLSNDITHVSIQSQYSASVVAPAFAALFTALARWERAQPGQAVRVLGALTVLGLSFTFAQGPTPLGLNFWNKNWGHQWYYRQYLPDRQAALDAAATMIPADPDVMVVSQNDINSSRLAHRHYYFAFPNGLERADYVLLDSGRRPFLYWVVPRDRRPYDDVVEGLRRSPDYRVLFDRDGVLLFARVTARRPGPPDRRALPALPSALPQ